MERGSRGRGGVVATPIPFVIRLKDKTMPDETALVHDCRGLRRVGQGLGLRSGATGLPLPKAER
jgi:hypothetical protein